MIKNNDSLVGIFEHMSLIAKKNNALNLSQGIPDNIYDDLWNKTISDLSMNTWQYQPSAGYSPLIQKLLSSFFQMHLTMQLLPPVVLKHYYVHYMHGVKTVTVTSW